MLPENIQVASTVFIFYLNYDSACPRHMSFDRHPYVVGLVTSTVISTKNYRNNFNKDIMFTPDKGLLVQHTSERMNRITEPKSKVVSGWSSQGQLPVTLATVDAAVIRISRNPAAVIVDMYLLKREWLLQPLLF